MADIRIKDLTTLESASLTGDVFVIDGTTGTRKLSAFSPSFGGNATVTGTLTVNGGTTLNATLVVSSNVGTIGKSGTGTGGNWRFVSDDGTTRWLSGILGGAGETSFSIYDIANSRSLLTATAAGVVQINQTTASTTTSTGALVVSGGVGIGGSLNAGANNAANSITGGDSGSGTYILQLKDGGGNLKVTFKGNGDVNLQSSTASTSTSSGALVVSGGVGVAGAMYVGGKLVVSGGGENVIAGNTVFSTGQIRVTNAYTPASASDTSPPGSITWDNLYIYVAVGTNTWKRVAISSW